MSPGIRSPSPRCRAPAAVVTAGRRRPHGPPPRHRRAAQARTAMRRRGSAPFPARPLRARVWSCRHLPPRSESAVGPHAAHLARRESSCVRPTKLVARRGRAMTGEGSSDGSGDLGRGRRGHHRGFAGARRAVWGWVQRRARRPAGHASGGRCRAPQPVGRCGTGQASAVRPGVRRVGRLDRRHELTEEVRVPSCLQRGVVAIQRGRNTFRLKGVAHIVDPRCVK